MRIAEIVPVSCLDHIEDNYYQMCLAHLASRDSTYANFYKRCVEKGKYVLMDNGACEGELLPFDELLSVYDYVNPTEIILPDVLKNKEATLYLSNEFYSKYHSKLSNYKIMAVPQGRDLKEWMICLGEMMNLFRIDTIGIPKWLGDQRNSNRLKASLYLLGYNVDIHLLGCSEGPQIVKYCENVNSRVRGCDSAFAYIAAKSGESRIDETSRRPKGSIDFLNDPYIEGLNKMMRDFEIIAGVTNNKEEF